MQLAPCVLGGAAVAAAICAYWLLKRPSGPRQGAGKTAGNAQATPTRRTSITPSLGRRRATIASPRTLERQDTSVLMRSAATARLEAARANCFAGQRHADLEKECLRLAAAKQTWHDDAFPRTDESMFVTGIPPADWAIRDGERGKALKNVRIEWHGPWSICGTKRPLGTNSRGERSWLFHCLQGETHGIDANDVQQGALGDCYFLSALALVATNCVCADGLVDDSLDQAGCFGVSLWVGGAWTMVYVDGYFPCYVSTDPHARAPPKPLYAASVNRREIWPMVVEKAYAKLHGSYEAIGGGGQIGAALQALTGGSATSLPTAIGAAKLWAGLSKAVRDPAVLVGAGTRRDCPASIRRGIIEGHAYSVLHAVEARDRRGATHRLLLLRNPWAHGEWHGPWSDRSELWGKLPRVRAAVGDGASDADDGLFWMAVDDFCAVFAAVELCRLPGGAHRRTANATLTPRPRPSLAEVPLAGMEAIMEADDEAPAGRKERLKGELKGVVEEEESDSETESAQRASGKGAKHRRRKGRKGRR